MPDQTPTLLRPAQLCPRSRVYDGARWQGYKPRASDIIIGTYAKCGTTWTQHIVGMLVFGDAEPRSILDFSPWPDFRFMLPEGAIWAIAEAQQHRRYFKTHLPLTAIPLYKEIKYIHVARDGRDAAMSLHNHMANFTEFALQRGDEVSKADPKFGDSFPRTTKDPAKFFHEWLETDRAEDAESLSFIGLERSYWQERKRANVLLVHYNDLKADLSAEMHRIAKFLGITIAPSVWPSLIEAAGFDAMKRNGDRIMPAAAMIWEGGAARFIHKGTNNRWQSVFAKEDLETYDKRVKAELEPALARWLEGGRLKSGDPALTE